ncbi:MAG: gliding motility lipoprotein GldD [Bacteroidetes bacterium]|nr:gliding motility lipoprotein GldD [Bacteroidota bacterium]
MLPMNKRPAEPLRMMALLVTAILLYSCTESYTPKPSGFFRIDLPKKQYRVFDSTYPYRFSYPSYARIVPKTDSGSEPYWMNVEFPKFKGTLHLSYKTVKNNLPLFLEESRDLVMKHIPKANGIDETVISKPENKVYGMMYDIRGNNAASAFQFYLTDSTSHFIRGALYFWVTPNNDSLKPVIDFLKEDMKVMIESLKWKKN